MVAIWTTFDNTPPPSNCGPREPYGGKEEPKNFDPNNGAIFHDEGSNDSKNIHPKNIGDNVFNDGTQVAKKEVLIQTKSLKETVSPSKY